MSSRHKIHSAACRPAAPGEIIDERPSRIPNDAIVIDTDYDTTLRLADSALHVVQRDARASRFQRSHASRWTGELSGKAP